MVSAAVDFDPGLRICEYRDVKSDGRRTVMMCGREYETTIGAEEARTKESHRIDARDDGVKKFSGNVGFVEHLKWSCWCRRVDRVRKNVLDA